MDSCLANESVGDRTGGKLQLTIHASLQWVLCGRDFRKKIIIKRGKNGVIIQVETNINNPEKRFLRIHRDEDKEVCNVHGSGFKP